MMMSPQRCIRRRYSQIATVVKAKTSGRCLEYVGQFRDSHVRCDAVDADYAPTLCGRTTRVRRRGTSQRSTLGRPSIPATRGIRALRERSPSTSASRRRCHCSCRPPTRTPSTPGSRQVDAPCVPHGVMETHVHQERVGPINEDGGACQRAAMRKHVLTCLIDPASARCRWIRVASEVDELESGSSVPTRWMNSPSRNSKRSRSETAISAGSIRSSHAAGCLQHHDLTPVQTSRHERNQRGRIRAVTSRSPRLSAYGASAGTNCPTAASTSGSSATSAAAISAWSAGEPCPAPAWSRR